MLKRVLKVTTAVMLLAQLGVGEARADNWFDFSFLWPHRSRVYNSDQGYMPASPRRDPKGGKTSAPFDENYYDPTRSPSQSGRSSAAHKPVKQKTTKAPKPSTATATTSAPGTIGEVQNPAPGGSARLSCDKAQKVVAGYGFVEVKPAACTGKVFAFNAMRDGKPYTIKVDAASGELTEVKKMP